MRYCTWSVLGSRDWPGTFHTYPDGIQQPSGDSRPVSGSSRTSSVGPSPAAGGARELWELPARTGARSSRAVPGDSRTQVGGSSRENSRGDLPSPSWELHASTSDAGVDSLQPATSTAPSPSCQRWPPSARPSCHEACGRPTPACPAREPNRTRLLWGGALLMFFPG